jgi:hypothetical protein
MRRGLNRFCPIVAGQLVLGVTALLLVAFAPPAQGRMLLVPLDGHPISAAIIERHQATPLKPGPVRGSWIVNGRRAALAGLFSSEAIIVLAAPDAICGGPVLSEEQQA